VVKNSVTYFMDGPNNDCIGRALVKNV